MPRMQPPTGWLRNSEVTTRLQIADSLLARYVAEGKIRHHIPHGRKYGFYNEDDVRALEEAQRVFPSMKQHKTYQSFLTIANRSDIPTLARIDHDAIHPTDSSYLDASFLQWHQKNPEILFSLRNTSGTIVGFFCILPLQKNPLDHILAGTGGILSNENIALFTPGNTIHLFVGALAVDPSVSLVAKHTYGAALLFGFFRFLMTLAERGVSIETITARSHTHDGIKLMRRIGIPWLISPNPESELFSVRVAESGIPFLKRYRKKLAESLARQESKIK
ncbi:MAG: hypothetical protein ACRDHW_07650 [Ktedonobacteraceae bacterium]